jgi:Acyl-protein synthetase, LuxE
MHPAIHDYADRLRERVRRCVDGSLLDDAEFGLWACGLAELQAKLNPVFGALSRSAVASFQGSSNWRAIPAIPTDSFKELDVTTLSAAERTVVFESSGTTVGDRSRNFHDGASVALYEDLAAFGAQWAGLVERRRVHYSLTPDPSEAVRSSLARMLGVFVARFGGEGSGFFGSVDPDGLWRTDFEGLEGQLREANGSVWISGTAFQYVHWADSLAERGMKLRLPSGSLIMETGGYKGRSRELGSSALAALISENLGVRASEVLTEYGMCELASQAYGQSGPDGEALLKFPPWARVRLVSPETGAPVADGETGLVQVVDLANVASAVAIQTGDLGVMAGGALRLLGRRGTAPRRGCSLMAA